MKGHGGFESLDWPNAMQYFRVAVVGAGAAPPVAPAGLVASLTTTPDFPVKANALSRLATEIPTRTGTGVYTITYDASFSVARILNTPVDVYGVAGIWAAVTSVVVATRVITVSVFNAGGAATDLTNQNLLVLSIEAQDSNA